MCSYTKVQEIRKLVSIHYLASAWDRFGYMGDHMGKLQIACVFSCVQDLGGGVCFFSSSKRLETKAYSHVIDRW